MLLFKRKPKEPCKHYWVKDIREYVVFGGDYTRVKGTDKKPKWKCKHCYVWEEDIKKNKKVE